jgi:hypothetical protein
MISNIPDSGFGSINALVLVDKMPSLGRGKQRPDHLLVIAREAIA